MIIDSGDSGSWENSLHPKQIGDDLWLEESMTGMKKSGCPYCSKQSTPVYIFRSGQFGLWICGDEPCVIIYTLRTMAGDKE